MKTRRGVRSAAGGSSSGRIQQEHSTGGVSDRGERSSENLTERSWETTYYWRLLITGDWRLLETTGDAVTGRQHNDRRQESL